MGFVDAAAGISRRGLVHRDNVHVTISVVGPAPQMSLDEPAAGSTLPQPFTISGWAMIRRGVRHRRRCRAIWAFDWRRCGHCWAAAWVPRSDVGAAYGARFVNSGWSLAVRGLPPGNYTLQAHARSTVTGTFNQSRSAAGLIVQAQPLMAIDTPADGSQVTQPFTIAGWAVDLASLVGTGVDVVHVWAQPGAAGSAPIFLGSATYGAARPDIATLFGARFTLRLLAVGGRAARRLPSDQRLRAQRVDEHVRGRSIDPGHSPGRRLLAIDTPGND